MDPLTLVTSITGIAAVSLQTARRLDQLLEKFQNAGVTITALSSQCHAIRAGLGELQSLVALNNRIHGRPDVLAVFDSTLTGCMVVLSCLDSDVEKLRDAETATSSKRQQRWSIKRFWVKATIVWKEDQMQSYLKLLQGQQTALSFLVQLLQM